MGHFLPFYSPKDLKNKNFEKKNEKKMPGGISLLHICITYMKIMMYDSWNIRCDSSPSPLTYWKIKSLKPWRYYHFTNVYHKWQSYDVWLLRYGAQQTKIMTICYTVPEKRHVTDVIFIFHSGLFFVLLPLPPSLMTQKIKILKKWKKNNWRYHHFICV